MALPKIAWRLILSYVFDWFMIIIIAAIGGGLSYIRPAYRPFSLTDLRISYPYNESSVSTSVLVVVSLIIPALLIAVISLVFLPHFTIDRNLLLDRRFYTRKIWEWNAGWLGLALSYASALLLTQLVKNVAARPRPDLLSRCGPNADLVSANYRGGYGQAVANTWVLVDVSICTAPLGQAELDDGFRSFFSGHSSSSFAGLLYLSLWLAVKCNITLPHWYGPSADHESKRSSTNTTGHSALPTSEHDELPTEHHNHHHERSDETADDELRSAGAAAPVWGFVVFFIPIIIALYIALTRYREYKHDGIDVSTGILVGSFTSYFGFRSYHASLRKGKTWTYAPRKAASAFWIGGPSSARSTGAGGQTSGTTNGAPPPVPEKRSDDVRPATAGSVQGNGYSSSERPRAYEEV